MSYAAQIAIYVIAGFLEIGGCFAFWAWLRLGKSTLWLIPGVVALVLFAWILTKVQADFAGRAYAAYGGIYVLASILWLWLIEGKAQPDMICWVQRFVSQAPLSSWAPARAAKQAFSVFQIPRGNPARMGAAPPLAIPLAKHRPATRFLETLPPHDIVAQTRPDLA